MLDNPLMQALLTSPVSVIIEICLLWARSAMFLGTAQVFGLVGMPRSLRMPVAMLLAIFLAPIHMFDTPYIPVSQWMLALFVVKEVLLGLALGALVAVPIWIIEGVGALFDNQRGAMTGQTFNPMLSSPSPVALLFQYAAVSMVLGHGGLGWICEFFAAVVRLWPPTQLLPTGGLPAEDEVSILFSAMNRGMLLYFAPLLGVMFLVEVAVALMSVYAPQIQAFTLAMPAKTLVGLILLVLVIGILLDMWWAQTSQQLLALLADARERWHGR